MVIASGAVNAGSLSSESAKEGLFFFEKKNQKTFTP
jgi:hypothetical protein